MTGIQGLELDDEHQSTAQLPSRDECRYGAGDTIIEVGVGVVESTVEDLRSARRSQPYLEHEDIGGLGEGAYFTEAAGRVTFLAADRILTVNSTWAEMNKQKLVATGRLFAAQVDRLEATPARVTVDACHRLAKGVRKVLGGPAEVRRDRNTEDGGFSCNFADGDTFVSVSVLDSAGEVEMVKENGIPDAQSIPDVGQGAFYSSGQGIVLVDEHTIASVLVEPAPKDATPDIIALLEASLELG